jgi:hypothetical protein
MLTPRAYFFPFFFLNRLLMYSCKMSKGISHESEGLRSITFLLIAAQLRCKNNNSPVLTAQLAVRPL